MSEFSIRSEGLAKRYRLGSKAKSQDTLMGALSAWARMPLHNLRRLRNLSRFTESDAASDDVIWALKDVSFDIKQGEVVGLIGRNGAGKSTLLKIVARIVEPSKGRAIVNGRISCLLEVGTGFHPDLTGRENVYFNGVLLGMSKVEMDRKFDEIVEFSGVEKFIDTPVKRYSSGMLVRLAFSVAAHLEPEILLVDEVLAVGDASFQKKCMGKMEEVRKDGRTILFVSHNLDAIRQLCPRAIWFDGGQIRSDGPVEDVAQLYLNSLKSDEAFTFENKDHGLTVQSVVLKNSRGDVTTQFSPGEDLTVEVRYDARQRIEQPSFALGVVSSKGTSFAANMLLDGAGPAALQGPGLLVCTFRAMPVLPQSFGVHMWIRAKGGKVHVMEYQEVASFIVAGDLHAYGYKGELALAASSTPVVVPYEWTLPDGSVAAVSLSRPRQ